MNESFHRQRRALMAWGWIWCLLITAGFAGLGWRVFQLQKNPDQPVAERVEGRGSRVKILPRRGGLLDAKGRLIAASRVGYRLYVDPQEIGDIGLFAPTLAHAIGDDPARIDQLISERVQKRYVIVNQLLEESQAQAVRQLDLKGVGLEERLVRHYPYGALAGQLVGFVGLDHNGLGGLELELDRLLAGTPGKITLLRDVRRRPLWIDQVAWQPARDGMDVRLSLDMMVQSFVEKSLDETCRKYRAKSGEMIVMDSRNGQVLAMANWPPFDPNELSEARPEYLRNRCLTDPYEPGSVFKPFIHAAATAGRFMSPREMVDCTESGVEVFGRRRLRDAHAHGRIDWDEVLVVSSNIGMAHAGQRMGREKLFEAVRGFGFGDRSRLGLSGESPGIVNPLRQWTSYSVTSLPMGQEVAVTPIQMVRAFSAFANDGRMVEPSVLFAEASNPCYRPAIDGPAARHTRQVMRRVVTEGTGKHAQSDLYRIWGKTGTAQVPDRVRGGYRDRAYVANFICGAPLDDPRLVVLVTVHEPDPVVGYYGGTVAAPPAKKVIEQTLAYLGVEPDVSVQDTGRPQVRVATAMRD